MAARTPGSAVEKLRLATAAILGCVTDRPVLARLDRHPANTLLLTLAPPAIPTPLRRASGSRVLGLLLRRSFVVESSDQQPVTYALRLTSYNYQVLDAHNREIIAYHWHPESASPIITPHLHLTSRIGEIDLGAAGETVALGEMHLPTGFVTPAAIVRLLIPEFGVAPRRSD